MDFLEMSMDIDKIKKFQAGLFDKIEGNRKRLNTHTVTKTDYDLDQGGIVKLISKLETKLNKALESGTAVAFHGVYHETINNRISAICDALGMDLNGHKSPKITALENRLSGSENITSEQIAEFKKRYDENLNTYRRDYNNRNKEINELKGILQNLIPISINAFNQLKHAFSNQFESNLLNASTVYKSYKELLEKLDSKPKKKEGCFNCKYLSKGLFCDKRDGDSYEEFIYTTFKTGICNNWKPKDSGGEKDKDLVRLKGMPQHRLEAKSDSRLPDLCKECGGHRMGERMMHNDWCSQCTTSTTEKKEDYFDRQMRLGNIPKHQEDSVGEKEIIVSEGSKLDVGSIPEVQNKVAINSKPIEYHFQYIQGGKKIVIDGLIAKRFFVKDLRDLHDFSLVPPRIPQEQINMIRFKIEQLLIKYT